MYSLCAGSNHRSRKGAMELEYIVKMSLLVLFFAVMAKIVYDAYWNAQNAMDSTIGPGNEKDPGTIEVRGVTFTDNQLANYIYSCWSRTGEDHQGDLVCYVLEGDFSGVTPSNIQDVNGVPSGHINVTFFDTSKSVAVIKFVDIGNKIFVESLG